jgi:hypothetical protein
MEIQAVNDLQILLKKIIDLRASRLNIDEFQSWVTASRELLSKKIPQGVLLKLKNGDMGKIMSASIGILPSCIKCDQIFGKGEFASRAEHAACSVAVEKAHQNGILVRVKKPVWYKPIPGQLGPDEYYQCSSCGSIWNLVEPERHCNGLWDRIA